MNSVSGVSLFKPKIHLLFSFVIVFVFISFNAVAKKSNEERAREEAEARFHQERQTMLDKLNPEDRARYLKEEQLYQNANSQQEQNYEANEQAAVNEVYNRANQQISAQHMQLTGSMRDQAQSQKNKAAKGERMGYATAGIMGGIAAITCISSAGSNPLCIASLAGVGLAFSAANQAKKSKKQSEQTLRDLEASKPFLLDKPNSPDPNDIKLGGNIADCTRVDCGDGKNDGNEDPDKQLKNIINDPNSTSLSKVNATNILRAIEQGKKNGVNLDLKNNKITLPNGKSYPFESLLTPSGLSSIGLNKNDINKFQDTFNQAAKQAEKAVGVADATEGSGAGNSGKKTSGTKAAPVNSGFGFKSPSLAAKPDRGLASVSGLARSDGSGGKIGVAGDELFLMINRNFEKNSAKGFFIDPTLGF